MNCIELHVLYVNEHELWIVWNYMKYKVYVTKCMNERNGMEYEWHDYYVIIIA